MKYTTRLAVVFSLFIGLFSVLVLRLWFVQIAEGAEAAALTQDQNWVTVYTPAPRGNIYDSNGELLATSRYVPTIWVDRSLVRSDQRDEVIQRLSSLLSPDITADEIAQMYDKAGPNGRFQVATVDTARAYQVSEDLRKYPGVQIEKTPERVYLTGSGMAHVLGHLGRPTADDLAADPGLDPNVKIGKLGVEGMYQTYLAGTPGSFQFQVRQSELVEERPEVPPTPGNDVYLTLDWNLQQVVDQALAIGVDNANAIKDDQRAQGKEVKHDVQRAAAVVFDVKTGAIRAMASFPTFQPEQFVTGLDQQTFDSLNSLGAFQNLAVSGLYPPASTFKAITYMAELQNDIPFPTGTEGVDAGSRLVHCDGKLEVPLTDGSTQVLKDWYYPRVLGWFNEHQALQNSCNIYFWSVALGVWQNWKNTPKENVIQDEARALGFGSKTGIDLPGEAAGVVPDRALYESYKKQMLDDPDNAPKLLSPDRLEAASPWYGGDLMNVAIGQGGFASTPLQVAEAYATLANGGTRFQPYVVEKILDQQGQLTYVGKPTVVDRVPLDPANVKALLQDLNAVVTTGTARKAFEGFGPSLSRVGGKTGTGQSVLSKDNHAWFAGVLPIDDPQYVVVVLLDEGGSGGAAAAPVARYIMQYLMGEQLDPIEAGAYTN